MKTLLGVAAGCAFCSVAFAQPLEVSPLTPAPSPVQLDYETLFRDMYRTPSNLDVTFKFAEQAVQRGDYEAAIGALERMLFFNSNLPRVKLELGVLYFKLGSYDLARSYLQDATKGSDVPIEIRTQVNAYLAEIERRLSPYEYSVFLQAGLRYQTNANFGPSSLLVRAFGNDYLLGKEFGKQPDWNSFESISAFYAVKLNPRGDAFEVTFQGYNSNQFKLRQFDLGLVEATVGHRVAIGQTSSIKAYMIGDAVWLGNAPYFNAGGGGVSARTTLGNGGILEAIVEDRNRVFSDSMAYPTASQQTGQLFTAAVTSDLVFGPVHFTTRIGFDDNRTTYSYNSFNSYKRYSIDVAFPYGFTANVFGQPHEFVIAPTAGYSTADYAAPYTFVVGDTNIIRHDREQRYGVIFDAQIYQNIGLRTVLQYSKIDSNIPNYTTSNFSVAIGPTARF